MLIWQINFSGVNAQSLVLYYPEAYHLNIFSWKRKVPSSKLKRRISIDVIGWSPGALSIKSNFSVGNFGNFPCQMAFVWNLESHWQIKKTFVMSQEENKMKMEFCVNGTVISTPTSWNGKSRKNSVWSARSAFVFQLVKPKLLAKCQAPFVIYTSGPFFLGFLWVLYVI